MTRDLLFLDTVYIQALLNRHDDYHDRAKSLYHKVRNATEVWVTEAILVEVGNALSATNRSEAVQFIQLCYQIPNMRVVSVDKSLLKRGLELYHSRPDKDWGLTDCISFVAMREQNLIDALTADRHFVQAGFRALLL